MRSTNKRLITIGVTVVIIASGPASAKTRADRRPTVAQPRQVACTVLGCQPIPAACYPKEQHGPTGIPTGFDQIVCPPGVWPF
jgi:hypothetical protein